MKNVCYSQQKALLMEYLLQKETKVPATAFLGHEATVLPPRPRDILLKGHCHVRLFAIFTTFL